MPQAIPAIIAGAKAAITWKAVGTFVVQATLATAASHAINKLTAPKTKGISGNQTGIRLEPSRDIMQAGRVIYGTDRVGHTVRLRHVVGEYLYYIAVWAFHECDGIEAEFMGSEELTFDGSGNATGKYAGHIRRTHHLGAWDQTCDANFLAEIPTIHTENHRGRGVCWTAYRFKRNADLFSGGLQNLTARVRGRKVWDIRDEDQDPNDPSTWQWSDNALLCRLDYMRGVPMKNHTGAMVRPFGLQLDDSRFLRAMSVLIASANACDEDVDLEAGGSEKRYRLSGSFDTDSEHSSVITGMESADGGRTLFIGGQCYLRSAYWQAPDFDLTENMIRRGQRRTRTSLSRRERFNLITGSYTNPAANYQRTPFPPMKSETFITEDGGELPRSVDYPFVNSMTQAERLARLSMLRSRQGVMYQQPCTLAALGALTGENIRITRARLGWTNKHFELQSLTFSMEAGDRGGIGFAVSVSTQETDASIFDWTTSLEQAVDPAPNTSLPNPFSVPTPQNLLPLSNNTTGTTEGDGHYVPRLLVSWDAITVPEVLQGGKIEREYKRNADSVWIPLPAIPGNVNSYYITDVRSGVAYDGRTRYVNASGTPGAWASFSNYSIPADQDAPSVPTDFAMVAVPDGIRFTCTSPAELDTAAIDWYYNLTGTAPILTTPATFSSPTKPGAKVEAPRGGLTAGVTYYGWSRGRDGTGNVSAWTSVQSAAPTVASGYVLTQLNGKNRTYYQTTAPGAGMIEGDLWFDTDDQMKAYRYNGTSWVTVQDARIPTLESGLSAEISTRASADTTETINRINGDNGLSAAISVETATRLYETGQLAAEYVLKVVAGNRIAGFRITNLGGGADSDFVIQASVFRIVNDSGAHNTVPFQVDGSGVYIDKAVIREVNAGAILAGTIAAALTITAPTINGGMVSAALLRAAVIDFGPLIGAGGPGLSAIMDWEHNGGYNWRLDIDDSTGTYRIFNPNASGIGGLELSFGTPVYPLTQARCVGDFIVDGGYGFGDFVTYSSRKLKNNIKPMRAALPILRRFDLVEFDWRDEVLSGHKGHDFGNVAEQAEEILSDLVVKNKAGVRAMRLAPQIALHHKAIQEIDRDFDRMAVRVTALEELVAKLSKLKPSS